MKAKGSRRTGQEVADLRNGLSPLKNFNQPFDSCQFQLGNFPNQIHTSIANNYGAQGNRRMECQINTNLARMASR